MSVRSNVAGTISRFGKASAMSGAQMRALVESIGLTRRDVHRLLEVSESSVSRWWGEQASIPVGVAEHVQAWVRHSDELVEELAEQLRTHGFVRVYSTDEELAAAHPDLAVFGSMHHRVAAARALDLVPDEGADALSRLAWRERDEG